MLFSVNQKMDKMGNENALKRFREYFKYDDTEQLWGEYSCHVIHKKGTFPAYVFVSTNHLSIVCDDNLVNKKKVQIDIKTIVSIQFAITYSKKGDAPLLQLTGEKEKADGIQVYTSDCKIHLFNKIVQSKTEFANILDKCWKASYMIQGKYTRQKPGYPPQTPYDNISTQQINQQQIYPQNQQINPQINQQMYPQNQQMNQMLINQPQMYPQNPQMMNPQQMYQYNPNQINQQQMYPQNPQMNPQQMYQYNPNQMHYNQQMNPQMMGNQNYYPTIQNQYPYNSSLVMNQNMYQMSPQNQLGNTKQQTKPPPFNPEIQN
eukprot:TRINITY_DN1853_c0_g1_i4.p1 TRINITY_DN1853_c0_g1~~TRINITY_DN1853_c0_g1_i4.p1  ORF type:complete len:318 (-),score=63.08 TRINITY_DN1853_c0_g1_i4:25-978(-)